MQESRINLSTQSIAVDRLRSGHIEKAIVGVVVLCLILVTITWVGFLMWVPGYLIGVW